MNRVIQLLILVLFCITTNASQYTSAPIKRMSFESYVDNYETKVLVQAELNHKDNFTFLDYLSVSYLDTKIKIPIDILRLVKEPVIKKTHLAYCGRGGGVIIENPDGTLLEPIRNKSKHPCLLLFVYYGEKFKTEDPDYEEIWSYPYISININEGEITDYTLWNYNGKEWIDKEYEYPRNK